MKRDMDIIRLLLLAAEGDKTMPDRENDAAKQLASFPQQEVAYNAALLIEAGLAEGPILRHGFGEIARVDVDRLTWAGHDFLDAARDDTLWKRAREKFMKPTASFTFEIVKEWLKVQIAGG